VIFDLHCIDLYSAEIKKLHQIQKNNGLTLRNNLKEDGIFQIVLELSMANT
jgi:hypothetical protein